ncbi:MAG: sulfatase-like hydrolase/transferase [Bryobacteraceae bacterium]
MITRREFAGLLAAGAAAGAARPNIVFFECDSMDGRVMGNMGHPAARTPNMDRLAAQGTLLRNTYCNSPQCVPSRSSMWSGLQTHRCEGWNNHKGLERGAPTFQTHLERAGYTARIFGKTDYLSGAHGLSGSISAWTGPAGIMLPEKGAPKAILKGEGREGHNRDWEMVRKTIAWIKDSRPAGPFFLHCGPSIPHPPFVTTQYWLDRIDPAKVTVPPYEARLHPVMEYMSARKDTLRPFSRQQIVDIRRTYFAMIAELDAMVGEVMDAVEQAGLGGNTYFIFTSDHGEMNMEHRQYLKNALYEGSARVPLIIAGPGVRRGAVVDDLVSLVDIFPTLMDMAGAQTPRGLDGHSLMPLLKGQRANRPDWVLSQYHSNMINTGAFMLRRGDWKYIAYAGYEPQLFNLKEDPEEMRNLAKSRPDVAKDMEARLRRAVDYPAVDAKVKQYDKDSFRKWRASKSEQEYNDSMAQMYKGWKPEHQRRIEEWLAR